ncbi:MAG: succinate-semialdehyde dehydrogenase/glutarate-semialdehyde dehydrogenase [Pseudohongiellaceae bacterium]|jgi:succinate-semialdehyde dehydrogenase/glutarate-semialdehyde dehydrogenase
MRSVNPATGETIREHCDHEWSQVEQRLLLAETCFRSWRETSLEHRAALLRRLAQLLVDRAPQLARLMTEEMGKLAREGLAEVAKCSTVCEFYAEQGPGFLARQSVQTEALKSFVSFQPLGPVLAVMPWNFPFWQVLRFAAPALMAGNVAVLKHASNVPGCATAIEDLFREAGFPRGCFTTLLVDNSMVERIIEQPQIKAVTLTGSTPAGRAVAAAAGGQLKKVVLELGGSDPYVILEDAELARAVSLCATSRMINGGQSCIAAKRFIVVDSVHDDFVARLVEDLECYELGDPTHSETRLGPMARVDLRDELHDQVRRSVSAGARCLLGGELPAQVGAWYPATVLIDVIAGNPAYREELFGPVATVIRARDEEDALGIANDSPFGLGAAIFTSDLARGERLAEERLEAGACFVNDFVKSDPRLPFGGVKDSGYGRELSSFGLHEFVNVKTVVVA